MPQAKILSSLSVIIPISIGFYVRNAMIFLKTPVLYTTSSSRARHGGAEGIARGQRRCLCEAIPRGSPFVPSKEAKNLTQRRKVRDTSENPETTRIHPAAQLCNLQCSVATMVVSDPSISFRCVGKQSQLWLI